MAAAKQIPLDELLFGAKAATAAKPKSTLAAAISVCFRERLAKVRRELAARKKQEVK